MTFVRTVLGDIPPSELGVTFAHEHVVIDGGRPVEIDPEFDLSDGAAMAEEVRGAMALGLRSVVDAMPVDAGRSARKLADLSRATGLHVIAPTGLHHDRWYPRTHWRYRLSEEEIADLFVADIEDGIDELDYSGPVVRRTPHRAGVIKIAGSEGGPSPTDRVVFAAAAIAHRRTGAPILTHCENGTGALEQVRALADRGAKPEHVVLSHVDKVADHGYHREIAATGAFVELDQASRWGDATNGTAALLRRLAADGLLSHVTLGNDFARRRYYRVFDGSPGLAWMLEGFLASVFDGEDIEAIALRLFVDNPARAFAFAEVT